MPPFVILALTVLAAGSDRVGIYSHDPDEGLYHMIEALSPFTIAHVASSNESINAICGEKVEPEGVISYA